MADIPIIISLNDDEHMLVNRNVVNHYLSLSELLILRKKVAASIRVAKRIDVKNHNKTLFEKEHQGLIDRSRAFKKGIKKSRRNGFVYLMLDEQTSLIKIGFSKDPKYRENTLLSQKPTIRLIFKKEASLQDERMIHEFFKVKRVRGEWFDLQVDDVVNHINSILP